MTRLTDDGGPCLGMCCAGMHSPALRAGPEGRGPQMYLETLFLRASRGLVIHTRNFQKLFEIWFSHCVHQNPRGSWRRSQEPQGVGARSPAVIWMLCAPKFACWNPNAQCDGRRWRLGEVLRLWRWRPHDGISVLVKETPQSSLTPFATWRHKEKVAAVSHKEGSYLNTTMLVSGT